MEVNGYWMCDDGRYGFANLDADRLGKVVKLSPAKTELSWADMTRELADVLKASGDGLAVVASGMLSNEDWIAYKDLFVDKLNVKNHYFAAEPDQVGIEDDLLRRKDKVPNLKGAENLGLKSGSFDELAKSLESGKIKTLYVIERDLSKIWGDKAAGLLAKAKTTIMQGPNKYALGDSFTYRMPATAYVEESGHFTNFEGKIGAYKKALAPIGGTKPDWEIFGLLRTALAVAKKPEAVA
jgi:NADH dehydrogenase/NADH:ubiquinone oxidoreductase subunit G